MKVGNLSQSLGEREGGGEGGEGGKEEGRDGRVGVEGEGRGGYISNVWQG